MGKWETVIITVAVSAVVSWFISRQLDRAFLQERARHV